MTDPQSKDDAKYGLFKSLFNDNEVSAYSGWSVILAQDGDASKVDWLVMGHDTTEILKGWFFM